MIFVGNLIATSMSDTNNNNNRNEGGTSGSLESFLNFLPVIVNSITGSHNAHLFHSLPHHTHPEFLPPFLENLHEYWDYFINSDFGKNIWENSGLSHLLKSFQDGTGQINGKKVIESLENNSFRRKWIKSTSKFIAQWLKHFTNPDIQRR